MNEEMLDNLIVRSPDTCSGFPRIKGSRMRVSAVLSYLASGMSIDEILISFPHLTQIEIRSCVNFAKKCMMEKFNETE